MNIPFKTFYVQERGVSCNCSIMSEVSIRGRRRAAMQLTSPTDQDRSRDVRI